MSATLAHAESRSEAPASEPRVVHAAATGEHEMEPLPGLPEALPAGERVLWQGAPRWQSIARRAFHTVHLAVYFGVLLACRGALVIMDGGTALDAAIAVAWLLPIAMAAIAMLTLMGWLVARTTLYTITNRRVVMRIGVVLTVTFNIPFRVIESAGMREHADGTGDIALKLAGPDRIAYLHLWPHARPWRLARAEPALRTVEDPARVAAILARAVARSKPPALRTAPPPPAVPATAATESQPLAAIR